MKATQLTQTIPTSIAYKMTPVLQLTDTDLACPLKAPAATAKAELARQMRRTAELARLKVRFACGAREIVKIAGEAHKATVEMNASLEVSEGIPC